MTDGNGQNGLLTISQLASHVGVTVRAVRHYHDRGLLAEPARDGSGYRRYDAQAVVDLIRIKALVDAGVPLVRIKELLAAGPEEFSTAVSDIDRALAREIRELSEHRRRIGELTGGDRLVLPMEVVDYLGDLRRLGMSERTVTMERDGWIIFNVVSPDLIKELVAEKRAMLADPEFQKLYVDFDAAFDWDPSDPRLEQLVLATMAWMAKHPEHDRDRRDWNADNPTWVALMTSQAEQGSPALRRLSELAEKHHHLSFKPPRSRR